MSIRTLDAYDVIVVGRGPAVQQWAMNISAV